MRLRGWKKWKWWTVSGVKRLSRAKSVNWVKMVKGIGWRWVGLKNVKEGVKWKGEEKQWGKKKRGEGNEGERGMKFRPTRCNYFTNIFFLNNAKLRHQGRKTFAHAKLLINLTKAFLRYKQKASWLKWTKGKKLFLALNSVTFDEERLQECLKCVVETKTDIKRWYRYLGKWKI